MEFDRARNPQLFTANVAPEIGYNLWDEMPEVDAG
jgi:hypothetical protein